MAILEVKDLSFKYPLSERSAISSLSFSIEEGEFIALCGATASGKSTLLRCLKRELTPKGEMSGVIRICGTPANELPEQYTSQKIGFVMQSPEQQIVTDKVWHELAFGLENMGVPQSEMTRRVAEMSSYFGVGDWFERPTDELSGGQKQLLCLASVMVMQPDILILDEPTAQLDPIAAADFIAAVKKLNRDLSLTVIIAEHRLEEIIPVCDKLIALENGELSAFGEPSAVIGKISESSPLFCGMPTAARIHALIGGSGKAPLSVREGRALVREYGNSVKSLPKEAGKPVKKAPALELHDVFFRYNRNSDDVLCGTELTVFENEIFCVLGGNGSGKSTMLLAAAGIRKPCAGKISVFGKRIRDYKNGSLYSGCLALMPQDVTTLFLRDTVREELSDVGADKSSFPYDLTPLLDKHPYDLSGGERQLAALAKVLAAKPRLLLLDEPTKGLDAYNRRVIRDALHKLRESGVTIVVVTHDVEFAAMCADRCALFFRGQVVSVGEPDEFFSGSSFYTTAASRITRGHFDNAVTAEAAAELCRLNGKKGGAV